MDIGGTSLDVCVVEDSQANVVHQTDVDHYPMLLTMYDIRSIGAGGGFDSFGQERAVAGRTRERGCGSGSNVLREKWSKAYHYRCFSNSWIH